MVCFYLLEKPNFVASNYLKVITNVFFFVLYWFAPFLKFGPLLSENPRYALESLNIIKTRIAINMKLSRVYFCIEGRRAILYINAKFSWVHCPIQAKIFIWFFCFLECPLRVKDSSAAVDLRFSRISRPEVFCKTGVLGNFKKNHRKIYVPESLFW